MIPKSLFKLSKEEEQQSIMIYGKIIKCLIAPYHHIKNIPLESNDEVYVYPERDLTIQQRRELLSIMVNSNKKEILFVTSDVFIIQDMIDGCVRILTPAGKLEKCNEKTFAANPHTILLEILQNQRHVDTYKNDQSKYRNIINKVISDIDKKSGMKKADYDKTLELIGTIGEPLIANALLNRIEGIKIT